MLDVRVDDSQQTKSGSLFLEDKPSPTPSEHKFESIHHNNSKADIDANMRQGRTKRLG
ncbi:hypothetical protein PKHYL_41290 [Psychrobacter sp. KH172YL61]|nr:hypothetical protein PKHYL_41290 [Psychrobacter sp. KH172YL61]